MARNLQFLGNLRQPLALASGAFVSSLAPRLTIQALDIQEPRRRRNYARGAYAAIGLLGALLFRQAPSFSVGLMAGSASSFLNTFLPEEGELFGYGGGCINPYLLKRPVPIALGPPGSVVEYPQVTGRTHIAYE